MMKRFFAILTAMLLVLTLPAMAEEATTLKVHGTGVVSVTSDLFMVEIGVRESAMEGVEVQATVNEKIIAIYDALIEAGADSKDISTQSLYIYGNYDYSGDVAQLTGYTATNTLSITTTDIDKMGEYIDIAFDAGANTMDSVDFSASDTSQASKDALELAVQNAYEKAEVIAGAAGMEIASVISFDETEGSYSSSSSALYANARTVDDAEGSTSLQASTLQVTATIIVEFELKSAE